jgi:hypothetical protein
MSEQNNAIQPVLDSDVFRHGGPFDRLVDGMAYMVAPSTLRMYRNRPTNGVPGAPSRALIRWLCGRRTLVHS